VFDGVEAILFQPGEEVGDDRDAVLGPR